MRSVWKDEARDLTPWLVENVDALAEALGTEIIPNQREVRVGSFSLDVLGTDARGRPVIIENQLAPTDHSHLGQLLVYASGLEASVVVWLTPRFREEHRRAIDWLNERTDDQVHFIAVELDLVRIGNSPPAPVFRVVAQPNDWQDEFKRQAAVSSPLTEQRRGFFESVQDDLLAAIPTFRRVKVGHDNWISMSSGPFGYYALSFASGRRLRAEIYLDTGDPDTTKDLFERVDSRATELSTRCTGELVWEALEGKRASRIALYREWPELGDEAGSAEARAWSVLALIELMSCDEILRTSAAAARGR